MKTNVKNIKNIAYIQNIGLLTNEQIQKYMGDIKYITSDDLMIIYKFMINIIKDYCRLKFRLAISGRFQTPDLVLLTTTTSPLSPSQGGN